MKRIRFISNTEVDRGKTSKYISTRDVFEYLYEKKVIDTEQRLSCYLWDFEKEVIGILYKEYKAGLTTDRPIIINGDMFVYWSRYTCYGIMEKVIKAVRNNQDLSKLINLLDVPEEIQSGKIFVKMKLELK